MTRPTDADLARWRALVEAASRGWEYEPPHEMLTVGAVLDDRQTEIFVVPYERKRDAEFVVAAREAVPALLDEVERLRQVCTVGRADEEDLRGRVAELEAGLRRYGTHRRDCPTRRHSRDPRPVPNCTLRVLGVRCAPPRAGIGPE